MSSSGAGNLSEVLRYRNFPETPSRTGHTIIVLDPEAFMSREEFDARMQQMIDEVHDAPTAPGVGRVSVPGEPELAHERESLNTGLGLDAFTWDTLTKTAEEFGRVTELTAARLNPVPAGGKVEIRDRARLGHSGRHPPAGDCTRTVDRHLQCERDVLRAPQPLPASGCRAL